ncbi:MAG: tyrosine-type recombinase/integrase [Terriglobales bacterium]
MFHLDRQQLEALFQVARAQSERDWLMILVVYNHGLRATEVVTLTPANLRDGFLTVKRLKGSRCTTQRLFDSDRDALTRLAAEKTAGERLFPVTRQHFWYLIQKHAKAAGIPRHLAHPHVLKHSIAMNTIRVAGIENVRTFLGHVSIASTGAYLAVDQETANAAICSALQ